MRSNDLFERLCAAAGELPAESLGDGEAWLATNTGWVRIANPPDGRCALPPGDVDLARSIGALAAEVRTLAVAVSTNQPQLSSPEYLNADEAVAYLRMPSRKALYQAVRRGQVPVRRVGRRRMKFARKDLDRVLSGRDHSGR